MTSNATGICEFIQLGTLAYMSSALLSSSYYVTIIIIVFEEPCFVANQEKL